MFNVYILTNQVRLIMKIEV